MSRARQTFRQSDLAKAIRAARQAGLSVARVEIGGGKIVVIPGKPGEDEPEANEWDTVR